MQRPFQLITVYRPHPDGSCKYFIKHLSSLIKPINRDRCDLVMIGDFDSEYKNKKNYQKIRYFYS